MWNKFFRELKVIGKGCAKIRSFPFLRLTSSFFNAIISCAHQIKAVILTILTNIVFQV